MTRTQRILGTLATTAIALLLLTAITTEPVRQTRALDTYHARAIREAAPLYAENCAECHGAAGEGIDINPALASEGVSGKDPVYLAHLIERGRFGTDMAAFGINEGGMLTNPQIESLVVLIQHADWEQVAQTVDAMGFTPPTATSTPTPTFTPSLTRTPSPTRNQPSATPGGGMFQVVPTDDENGSDATPTLTATPGGGMFQVVPTDDESGSDATPALTATPGGGMFQVVPTATP